MLLEAHGGVLVRWGRNFKNGGEGLSRSALKLVFHTPKDFTRVLLHFTSFHECWGIIPQQDWSLLVCTFSGFFRTVSQAALWLQICAWSMSLLRDMGWEASASLRWLKVRRKLLPVFKPSHHRLLVRVVLHRNLEKKALDSPLLTTSFGQSLDDPQEIPIRHEWCVGFCRKWSSVEHQLFTVVYNKILPHSYRHTCRLGSISCTRPGGDRVASEWKRCFPRIWASNHVLSRGQENQGDVLTGLSELTCCETVCLKWTALRVEHRCSGLGTPPSGAVFTPLIWLSWR